MNNCVPRLFVKSELTQNNNQLLSSFHFYSLVGVVLTFLNGFLQWELLSILYLVPCELCFSFLSNMLLWWLYSSCQFYLHFWFCRFVMVLFLIVFSGGTCSFSNFSCAWLPFVVACLDKHCTLGFLCSPLGSFFTLISSFWTFLL